MTPPLTPSFCYELHRLLSRYSLNHAVDLYTGEYVKCLVCPDAIYMNKTTKKEVLYWGTLEGFIEEVNTPDSVIFYFNFKGKRIPIRVCPDLKVDQIAFGEPVKI